MASTNDIRDIMDMGHDGSRQPAPKKKKRQMEAQARLSGISREVQALMGDSVPPVAIVETPKYKSKPSLAMKMFKVRHWEDRPFVHGARTDGLNLKHWKRSIPGSIVRSAHTPATTTNEVTPTDVEMGDGADKETTPALAELQFEDEFMSEKWNVQVQIPTFTDEQYEQFFKSDAWTREETDYLLQLCLDYDLRWILIADRYTPHDIPQPPPAETIEQTDASIVAPARYYEDRNMEALKSRYYAIAAKMLEIQTPASNMTQGEFQLWEKMRNFDAKTEATRKAMAEKLFERTKEEADEEKVLLEELYRITKNEEDFIKMRKDLYSRLDTAPSLRRNDRGEEQSTALYQTSAGLSMLLQSLLAKDKRLRRPAVPNGEPASASANQTDAQKWEKGRHPNQYSRRETMDSQADEAPSKKGSISQPVVKNLSPAEQIKYGVSHPQERLTSGVMFRHEKINRITTAKSQVQTQKISAALAELAIPPRLLMPTERVCREFERLVTEVQILLDTRRVLEKVSSEVKILEEQKRIRLGQNLEGSNQLATNGDAMEVDNAAAVADQQVKSDPNDAVASSASAAAAKDTRVNGASQEDDANADDDGDADETKTNLADEDEEEDEDADQTFTQRDEDDEEGDQDEEDEDEDQDQTQVNGVGDDDDEEEEEDDDDDAPGLEDLRRANQVTDDEEDEDEDREGEVEDSQVADDDDDDDDADNNQDEDGEDDEEEEEEEDDDAEIEDQDEALTRTTTQNGDDDAEEEEEDGEEEAEAEAEDENENDDDDEDEEETVEQPSHNPTPSHPTTRPRKRSASEISDGSTRNGVTSGGASSRKKRR